MRRQFQKILDEKDFIILIENFLNYRWIHSHFSYLPYLRLFSLQLRIFFIILPYDSVR